MNFKNWIPAFVGMALAAGMSLSFTAPAADSILGNKKPEFLPVDEAFEIQPLEHAGKKKSELSLGWRIAKGYYLYRERLKFTLAQPAAGKLGAAKLPAGEKHDDEHFGPTVIYRGDLKVGLPVTGAGPYQVVVQYQGCADAGLCYPPQTRTLELER